MNINMLYYSFINARNQVERMGSLKRVSILK